MPSEERASNLLAADSLRFRFPTEVRWSLDSWGDRTRHLVADLSRADIQNDFGQKREQSVVRFAITFDRLLRPFPDHQFVT